MTLLAIEDLAVTYATEDGPVTAVRDVSLTVAEGETVALVGESGSGKSQTALATLGLLADNATATGRVRLDGQDLLGAGDRALNRVRGRTATIVFQEPMTSLDPLLTVGTQIAEPIRRHQGLGRRAARARALELMRLVRLPEPERRIDAWPHALSGGQRQRVMIAMALANEPRLLIADEPTTALDVTIQAEILTLLAQLQKKLGMAILFITHDLTIVEAFADRVYVMRKG
ncbi:MAG: ATP-binding cassette domain-containing protein, partial [Pseudomonadota bacterium]